MRGTVSSMDTDLGLEIDEVPTLKAKLSPQFFLACSLFTLSSCVSMERRRWLYLLPQRVNTQ
jgi:hypothetical protein